MKKGFIIFLTENWLPIINNLLTSVLVFSKYDVEVNCINFYHDFKNDRVISKTIILNNVNFFNITKCKIIASVNTNFDYALLLDGDMIVTDKIDQIFDDNEEKIKNCRVPLFTKHPHNPFIRWKHITSLVCDKEPKMKWVYSVYLFTTEQKWFLNEVLNEMNSISNQNKEHLFTPVPEESIINALLAKYDIDYDMGYNYCPNGFSYVVDYYCDQTNEKGKNHIKECYLDYDCPVKFYAFHGHDIKNIDYGKTFINQLINAYKLICGK